MIRAIRPFLCLLIAIVFAMSSVGWSAASARLSAAPGAGGHHIAEAGVKAGSDHHHSTDHASDEFAQCDGVGAPCSENPAHDEATQGCCAMACHIAIEASGPGSFGNAISDIEPIFIAHGLRLAMTGRLDRPPRHADATVG